MLEISGSDQIEIGLTLFKAGVNLNGIFAPLNTGLVQISRSHFKQSKNSMLKTRIYVIGCFVNFLVIFGYIWVEIVFSKD